MSHYETSAQCAEESPASWSGVWGIAIGVASLVTSEFMPVSLLTPMARGVGVSEGLAGQTISATAIIAILTSLFLSYIIRSIDRRKVMLGFSSLMIVSSIIVSLASGFEMLLLGRLFLGMALGGFWSMSTSVAMRLVPEKDVAKAFAIIFGGVSAATVISGPLGSYLEGLIGWRMVFMLCALFSAVALVWQYMTLPAMAARGRSPVSLLVALMKRREVSAGMIGVGLTFAGHMAFFTYLRPFLEAITKLDVNAFTALLFAFGIANFIGNSVSGSVVSRNLRMSLGSVSALMFMTVLVILVYGDNLWVTSGCVVLWGFAFGFIPVGWSTWLTRTVTDQPEAAGSVYVAFIQLGLLAGAGVGGIIIDAAGVTATYAFAGAIMLASSLMIFLRLRPAA